MMYVCKLADGKIKFLQNAKVRAAIRRVPREIVMRQKLKKKFRII